MISSRGLSNSVEQQLGLFERFSCRLRGDHRDLRCTASDFGASAWVSMIYISRFAEPGSEISLGLAAGPRSGTFLPSERSLPVLGVVEFIAHVNYRKKSTDVMSFNLPLTIFKVFHSATFVVRPVQDQRFGNCNYFDANSKMDQSIDFLIFVCCFKVPA